jgi:hypothetical protein
MRETRVFDKGHPDLLNGGPYPRVPAAVAVTRGTVDKSLLLDRFLEYISDYLPSRP